MGNKLRDSAKGQVCNIRIPGVCNHDKDTTVLAHLNGSGTGTKYGNEYEVLDVLGSFACFDCHDAVDGRRRTMYSPDVLEFMHMQGMVRTIIWWAENGYIEVSK